MALITATTTDGKKVLINLDNVAYFYPVGDNTNINFLNSSDYITVPIPIEKIVSTVIIQGELKVITLSNL